MSATLTMQKFEDGYFDVAKRVEEPVLEYTGRLSDSIAKYVPQRPGFMAAMPRMTEVVDQTLKMRKRIVDEQAVFVRHLIKAMDPVVTKFNATPETKHVAAKPPATTSTAAKPAARRRPT